MSDEARSTEDDHKLRVQQYFMQHQQALLAYVLSLVPNLQDAQDIVQEVFLVVSCKAATWKEGTNFLAWSCSVARFEVLNFLRCRKQRSLSLDDDVLELIEQSDASCSDLQSRIEHLKECVQLLSPRARELILMRYHSSQMPEEIAQSIRWSVNAVRVALSRAKQSLRDCMDKRFNLEDC